MIRTAVAIPPCSVTGVLNAGSRQINADVVIKMIETMPLEGFSFKIDTHNRVSVIRSLCVGKYLFMIETYESVYLKETQSIEVLEYPEVRDRLVALGAWKDIQKHVTK